MLTSIIIPVFNDAGGLRVTLTSIMQFLKNRKDIEIIVCNDGGGEQISKVAASFGVHEVRLEKNKGSYAARNKGIDASKGEILVFLDANQQITENWLDAGLNSMRYADYAGGQIKIEAGDNPSDWELLDKINAFPVKRYLETSHFAPTANLFIRKDICYKIGRFNENLRSGGDVDFGIRVFENGLKQIYVHEAITLHPARIKHEQMKKLKRTAIGRAELSLFIQNKNQLSFILWVFMRFILVPIEVMWRLLRYPFFDYWKNDNIKLRFIYMKKFCKFIYFWNLMVHTVAILIRGPRRFDKNS